VTVNVKEKILDKWNEPIKSMINRKFATMVINYRGAAGFMG
jgi:hypothetical protein